MEGITIFTHILVPLDGSKLAECVLPHALAVARGFNARVLLLHVIEPQRNDGSVAIDPLDWEVRKAEAEGYLKRVQRQFNDSSVEVQTLLLEGRAAESIVTCAHEHDIDLLILSSHGNSGLTRWNVSSVTQKTILDAPASLYVVRAYRQEPVVPEELQYRRILIPLDGSQRAECVLSGIDALVNHYDANLLLVHVVSRPEMPSHIPLSNEESELFSKVTARNRSMAQHYLEEVQRRLSCDSAVRIVDGYDVTVALHQLAEEEDVDLVALSAHGYSGNDNWPYGSVTTSFINYSARPLLIVQDLDPDERPPTPVQLAAKETGGH